eukprot:3861499-Prymnesium_polylepis.1
MIWCGINCAGRSAQRLLFCGATKKCSSPGPWRVAVARAAGRLVSRLGLSIDKHPAHGAPAGSTRIVEHRE